MTITHLNLLSRWKQSCQMHMQVTLLVPWLAPVQQALVFPEGMSFELPEDQEQCIRSWVQKRAGFQPTFKVTPCACILHRCRQCAALCMPGDLLHECVHCHKLLCTTWTTSTWLLCHSADSLVSRLPSALPGQNFRVWIEGKLTGTVRTYWPCCMREV